MTLEGLDDGKYHFLKIRIQQIGLLLITFYLHKEGTGSLSESNPSRHVRWLTVPSMRCSRNHSDLESSSDGSWFRSSKRRRWRFSRNHSRFSNFVRIARSVTFASSWTSITRGKVAEDQRRAVVVELARDRERRSFNLVWPPSMVIRLPAPTHVDSLISACFQYAPRVNAPRASSASGRLVSAELSEGTALGSPLHQIHPSDVLKAARVVPTRSRSLCAGE